jgi:hypothetical protein
MFLFKINMAPELESDSELFEDEEMPNATVEIPQNLNWICSQKGPFSFRKVLKNINNRGNEAIESIAAQTLCCCLSS